MKKSPEFIPKDKRFELLRELLLEEQRKDLESLKEEIFVHEKFSERVSPLVDEKIEVLREKFPEYFGETITETIKIQIRDSQDEVIEALYPILGKLVKKFIVSEIEKLTNSINETIKEKFSFKEIIKRYFKGKNNNADIVLHEVFKAEIEEVFVINKESGLLAGSFSKGNIADKDMVAGMLTAIKSFAEDAFSKEGQDLEDIRFETFQLSIHNFKTIYIAVAISGVLNIEFKEKLSDNITNLAEVVLKNRACLENETEINEMIVVHLLKQDT